MDNTNGTIPMSENPENSTNLIDSRPIITNQPEHKKRNPPRRKKDLENNEKEYENNENSIKNITKELDGFLVHIQGVIESAQFFENDGIYCKYDIVCGQDWQIVNGQKTGQSQSACQGEGSNNYFIWNMPFEISLRSTNPTGWPQICISCFYSNIFGNEVLKAYGVCFVPTSPGIHERTLQMFSPISSKFFDGIFGLFLGQKPEIRNAPAVLSTGEGREIMRTQSEGSMNIKFNIHLTNMKEFGYDV